MISSHKPVMVSEILSLFNQAPQPYSFLDGTFGRGGHSRAFLQAFPSCKIVALDRDSQAIAYGRYHFPESSPITFYHQRFSCLEPWKGLSSFSGILLDLGVSSPQIDEPERGFSFMHEGPLDMRMDRMQSLCAATVINHFDEKTLATLFFTYGQERASRLIARYLVKRRLEKPFLTTLDLAHCIERLLPRRGKIHPATRVFQALRIFINEEIEELEKALPLAWELLAPQGCLAVLSFHSLEDRKVKQFFKKFPSSSSPKPLKPSQSEINDNPRARSACLRFGVKSL